MSDSNTSLPRRELFDLVWTKPTTRIAKDFGVQPAILIKACRLLNVPRPTTGHWVKVEHGHTPPMPALPPLAPGAPASITLAELMTRRKRTTKAAPPPEAPCSVPAEESTKWHFAVQKTRSALRGGYVDDKYGTMRAKLGHAHLGSSVTRGSLDRAFLILNQLAWLLERNGFTFVMPDKQNTRIRLVYVATATEIDFLIKEDVERYERELKPEEKGKDPLYIWNRWRYKNVGQRLGDLPMDPTRRVELAHYFIAQCRVFTSLSEIDWEHPEAIRLYLTPQDEAAFHQFLEGSRRRPADLKQLGYYLCCGALIEIGFQDYRVPSKVAAAITPFPRIGRSRAA